MKAHRTIVEIVYEGTDITRDIAADLLSFTWNDNESGQFDDIDITLKNDHGQWINAWLPEKGDVIVASIITVDENENRSAIYCGRFQVDEISFSGPPIILSIKAQSAPLNDDTRRTRRSKAWEDVTLQDIAKDIADRAGLRLIYDVTDFIGYGRIDQSRENDFAFLMRVCREEGLDMKVTDEQLVVFSAAQYEAKPPVDEIDITDGRIISWSLESQAHDLAKSSTVSYYDPNTGETNEATVEVPEAQPITLRSLVSSFFGGGES